MALWPFGKKKDDNNTNEQESAAATPVDPVAESEDYQPVSDTEADAAAASAPPILAHDAVNGDAGPFDGDNVDIEDFDFSDYSTGVLNLGSMKLPLPKGSQVQVEMGDQGPRMLHIVTKVGRITPVAFAAPTQGGQWDEASKEILEGMDRDGMTPHFEEGPWGREIAAEQGENILRIIGVDGPRWMLRMTLASTKDAGPELAQIARDLAARTFVYRGDDPILAGNSLPVALPAQLVEQVQQAMKQREEQARVQKQSDKSATQRHDNQAINDAAEALRNLGNNNNQGPTSS